MYNSTEKIIKPKILPRDEQLKSLNIDNQLKIIF